MKTITVPKSKFKPKVFNYLRMVENQHDQICITDHGKPVVKVVPFTSGDEKILSEMRGLVKHYENPFLPVGQEEWEVLR